MEIKTDKCDYCPVKQGFICLSQYMDHDRLCKKVQMEKENNGSINPYHSMLVERSEGPYSEPNPFPKEIIEKAKAKTQETLKSSTIAPEGLDPSLPRKMLNFTKSAANFVGNWVSTGEIPLVSQEIHDYRLSICETCELFDSSRKVCRHKNCGCNMENKTWLASERCPLNPPKWDVAIATER